MNKIKKKDFKFNFKLSKSSFLFQKILSVRTESSTNLGQQVLKFLLDEEYVNTAYICEDTEGMKLVRVNKFYKYDSQII